MSAARDLYPILDRISRGEDVKLNRFAANLILSDIDRRRAVNPAHACLTCNRWEPGSLQPGHEIGQCDVLDTDTDGRFACNRYEAKP